MDEVSSFGFPLFPSLSDTHEDDVDKVSGPVGTPCAVVVVVSFCSHPPPAGGPLPLPCGGRIVVVIVVEEEEDSLPLAADQEKEWPGEAVGE